MNFRHHQLVEIYSALKEGTWINQETKDALIERLEQYFIASIKMRVPINKRDWSAEQ